MINKGGGRPFKEVPTSGKDAMPEVVTIDQRKSREAARRRAAAAQIMRELRRYATEHQGRFLVFGSAAKNCIGPESDLDVIVDFPRATETPAVEYVEEICRANRVSVDVHARSTITSVFFERASAQAVVLG